MEPYEYDESYAPPKTSALAIASLVFAFLCQPVGFVLGVTSIILISRSQGRLGGMGLAIAGTIVSGVTAMFCMPMMAAVAIPGLLRSRVGANESSAIASLKAISTGQEQFRNAVALDQDGDGEGEFGFLSELGGVHPVRGGGPIYTANPYIPSVLGRVDANGVAVKSGYCFKLYLPGGDRVAVAERDTLPGPDRNAAGLQGRNYIVYAWPESPGRSGVRVFVVDAQGTVHANVNMGGRYAGPASPPPWDAALDDSDGNGSLDWDDGIGGQGWVPVW